MGNRKKVMWLIKGLGAGGAEKLLEIAIPYLDRDSFDYEFSYLLPWKNALVPEFEKAGIPVFCLSQPRAYDLRVVPQTSRLLRERQVDVLHVHLPYSGILGRIASKLSPVKAVVYTEHNLWQRYHWLTAVANRLTYGWNDAVIAVSSEVKRSIEDGYRRSGGPSINTILNGVDPGALEKAAAGDPREVKEEFGIPPHHQVVVHVANFTPKKRHVDLLHAASMVLREEPDVTFLLVGQGVLELQVKSEAQKLGITSNVRFAGFRADVPRLMAASDLFVLPSLYEGLPVSLLEAMALQKPVIATRVGGVPEVLTDGVEGFLVDPLDPGQLATRTLEVLHDPELQRRFSQNGIKRVREEFHIQYMVEQTESLYHRVLAEKGDSNARARLSPVKGASSEMAHGGKSMDRDRV